MDRDFITRLMIVGLTKESAIKVESEWKGGDRMKDVFLRMILVFGVDNFKEMVSKIEKKEY